jgi:hypothetical protein
VPERYQAVYFLGADMVEDRGIMRLFPFHFTLEKSLAKTFTAWSTSFSVAM